MKIEFVDNKTEEVEIADLKSGDWFVYGRYSENDTPRVYCLLDTPYLSTTSLGFDSTNSSTIRLQTDRKVTPVEVTLQVKKKPVRPYGTGCF